MNQSWAGFPFTYRVERSATAPAAGESESKHDTNYFSKDVPQSVLQTLRGDSI